MTMTEKTTSAPAVNPLALLMASAMALPAVAMAEGSAPVETELSYLASSYQEEDVTVEPLLGVKERFQIDVHQFRVLTPLSQSLALEVDLLDETLSGASPWGTVDNGDGTQGLLMSGASIDEHRQDIGLRLAAFGERQAMSFGGGYSQEDDYAASYVAADLELQSDDRNSAVKFGVSYSSDELMPSDAEQYDRVPYGEKTSTSVFLGYSQVLSASSVVQFSLSQTSQSGFLSDPYKLLDVRPEARVQSAFAVKWRQFIGWADSALHVDYRYYQDDWGISSDTVELAWHQPIADGWAVRPGLRFYSQSHADFFRLGGDDTYGGYQSTDYRLAAYGARTQQLTVYKDWRNFSFHLSIERYDSDTGYAIEPVDYQHPGLVDFTRASFGVDMRY